MCSITDTNMNERIEQLAGQARLSYLMERRDFPYIKEDLQKFAELIVRECAKIAKEDSDRYARFIDDPIMNGKADVLALCSHHILDNFGVEE